MTGKRNQTTEKFVGDLENLRSDMENAEEISDDLFFFPKHQDEEYFEMVLEKYDELAGHQIGEDQEVEQ